ncbi:MAG TPA: hypothetical protein VGP64_00885 [Polyangia bacterium]|jgi:hypothetical protein
MRASRFLEKLALVALALGATLGMGCKSYHYYDVDVKFEGGFTLENAGMIQLCNLNVSGADTGGWTFPDNDTNTGVPICPVGKNYPDLGTFEYASFEDSGTLHFVVSAFDQTAAIQANCFAAGSTDIQATSAITTTGTITLSMTTSGCAQ